MSVSYLCQIEHSQICVHGERFVLLAGFLVQPGSFFEFTFVGQDVADHHVLVVLAFVLFVL